MNRGIFCSAIRNRKRLLIRHGDASRVVEVHSVGITRTGKIISLVWQVRGSGNLVNDPGWKAIEINNPDAITEIDEESEAPRSGYKGAPDSFITTLCEI